MALSTQTAGSHQHQRKIGLPMHLRDPNAEVPLDCMPTHGIGEQMSYEFLTNELLLDGQARLNLATFVTTWMPSMAARLMDETADKNIIDKDEYPQTAEIESRCVNIIADLWHAELEEKATGCSTTG